jgi:Mg2+ and Co2+ transporter CorA
LVEFFFVFGVYGLNFNPNFYSDYISLILLLLDGNYSFF